MGEVNVTVLSIIVAYLIVVTLFGLWMGRKVKTISEYLIAGGKMGFFLVAMTLVGAWEGTGASIGVTQIGYTQGIYTGFYASFFAAGLVLTVFTLLKFVRYTVSLTPAELLGRMFGVQTRVLTSILLILQNTIVMGTQVVGGAGIMAGVLGIPYMWGLFIMVATAGLYTLLGGLVSNAWTNILHAIIQNLAAWAAVPIVLLWFGGWDTLVSSLPPKFFSVEGMGFQNLAGWWWTLGLGVIIVGFPQIQQAVSTREAEKGFWLAAALCSVYSMPFALLGVAAAAKFPGITPLLALPKVAMAIDPVFAGVLLASILAAALSTLGPSMSYQPLYFINDLYKLLKPRASDREQLLAARLFLLATIVVIVVFAATIQQIVVANVFAFTFRSVLLLTVVAGMVLAGRRWITAEGAFWGMLCGAIGIFVSQFALPKEQPIYLTLVFLVAGTILASLATRGRGHFSRSIWEIIRSAPAREGVQSGEATRETA